MQASATIDGGIVGMVEFAALSTLNDIARINGTRQCLAAGGQTYLAGSCTV